MPEGAPPTAGVLRSQAALPLWWVGGIVHVASAGVNPLFHFLRSRAASCLACEQQTGPTHGFHQCGIKPTGLDSISPYISSLALHTLETSLCLYTALLLVELTLT